MQCRGKEPTQRNDCTRARERSTPSVAICPSLSHPSSPFPSFSCSSCLFCFFSPPAVSLHYVHICLYPGIVSGDILLRIVTFFFDAQLPFVSEVLPSTLFSYVLCIRLNRYSFDKICNSHAPSHLTPAFLRCGKCCSNDMYSSVLALQMCSQSHQCSLTLRLSASSLGYQRTSGLFLFIS